MTPIHDARAFLNGAHRLPAGAIPLCYDETGGLICQTPNNQWIRWSELTRKIEEMPQEIQRPVLRVLVDRLGGTQELAKKLGISTRTIETWRVGRAPLPCKAAENIAVLLRI